MNVYVRLKKTTKYDNINVRTQIPKVGWQKSKLNTIIKTREPDLTDNTMAKKKKQKKKRN